MEFWMASLTYDPRIYFFGRRGAWRVHHVTQVGNPLKIRVDKRPNLGGPILRLHISPADKGLRKGTVCNPRKLLERWFVHARAERERIDRIFMSLDPRPILPLKPEHEWQGPGPMPAHWYAADGTKVYRSYEDYCD